MQRGRPRHDDVLTPREWEVLELIRQGLTNEQIAERLDISLATAKFHVSEIIGKLGVESRREAAAWRGAPRGVLGVAPLLALLIKLKAVSPPKAAGVGAIGAAGAAFVALMLGVVLGQSSPVEPSLGKIAYVMDGDIWVKKLPDGTPQRLTNDGGYSMPQWSPSGEWLSVMRSEAPQGLKAYVMRADGGQARQVDGLVSYWSPHGDRLAYIEGDSILVVEDADGAHRQEFLDPVDFRSGVFLRLAVETTYWSPDGEWLTYRESSRDFPPTEGSAMRESLHRVNVNDGRIEELYRPQGQQVGLQPGGWTTDGRFHLIIASGSSGSLLVKDLITSDPPATTPFQIAWAPFTMAPSPDGRTFVIAEGPGPGWASKRITLFDPATGESTALTSPDLATVGPAWSPDGSRIAYVAATAGPDWMDHHQARPYVAERRLWIMDADGSNQRQLTNDPRYRDEAPRWSADGRHILFGRVDLDAEVPSTSLWLFDNENGSLAELLSGLDLWESHGFHWLWAQQADWWRKGE